MKVTAILTGVLLSAAAHSSFADVRNTQAEENRGALGGAIVGAAIGGPVGAGAGAILGGGVLGKLWGLRRIDQEQRLELVQSNADLKAQAEDLELYIAELNKDIDTLLAKSSDWQKRQLPIQFKTASSQIEKHYEAQLKDVAELLGRNPDTSVVLSGFADRRGDESYNMGLSQERVAVVKAYLLSHGVRRNQVITQAFGETKPVSEAGSTDAHFFDRRVVMSFDVDMRSPLATR